MATTSFSNAVDKGQAAAPAATPASVDMVTDFYKPAVQKTLKRAGAAIRPGFVPRPGESRVLKIGGAAFLFVIAGAVWLLSESTTLSIPRIFTPLVDELPWSGVAWLVLLGMSFLIVAHTPHAGRLSIKDLWWVAFTLADTITTAVATVTLAVKMLTANHIHVVQGTDLYYLVIVSCAVFALIAVFAPIATMREAIRLIRWEL